MPSLDAVLSAGGFYRASTVLISGSAGTGKSGLAGSFIAAAAQRNERSLYIALEESQSEIVRNLQSIGVRLTPLISKDIERFHVSRPSAYGLEMHLASLFQLVSEYRPRVVVVDSITSLPWVRTGGLVVLVRLVDFFKKNNVTLLMTALSTNDEKIDSTNLHMSSNVDAWIVLRNQERSGMRFRTLTVVKARGMGHSDQTHEIVISRKGLSISPHEVPGDLRVGSQRE